MTTTPKQELLRRARSYGVAGKVAKMTVAQLREAIARRRAYLARPAADLPKSTDKV